MQRNPAWGCMAGPLSPPDLRHWTAVIAGPPDSPYEDGLFALQLEYPPEFPYKPPKATFLTQVYHPNISAVGDVSVDILSHNWSPALMPVEKQLVSIQSLLSDPNPDDPLRPEIARVYKTDRLQYEATAREWTRLYAM